MNLTTMETRMTLHVIIDLRFVLDRRVSLTL